MTQKRYEFHVERLEVFRTSVEFVKFVRGLDRCMIGDSDRRKQLWRAADSIALNSAEGVGRGEGEARRNFHKIAMGSASECAAVLVLMEALGVEVSRGRDLLARIGAMLDRMLNRR